MARLISQGRPARNTASAGSVITTVMNVARCGHTKAVSRRNRLKSPFWLVGVSASFLGVVPGTASLAVSLIRPP